MEPLAPYILQIIHSGQPIDPSLLHEGQIFRSLGSTPCLDKSRTNRIMIYFGSFNPPHRGHLNLLKFAFLQGGPDLNLVAAIVRPLEDEHVSEKINKAGGTFMFGRNERSLLWKREPEFPEWAWVYEDGPKQFHKFLCQLKEKTTLDGFKTEYVVLHGPGYASPRHPPNSIYGCEMVMICDAARKASYQRTCGRIRNFEGCTKWKQAKVIPEQRKNFAFAKTLRASNGMYTTSPMEAVDMPEDISHGPDDVKKTTQEMIAKKTRDLKSILFCHRSVWDKNNRALKVYFVKCNDESLISDRIISSTRLREAMSTCDGKRLNVSLNEMALSPNLLWRSRASWLGKAGARAGDCITLPTSIRLGDEHEPKPFNQVKRKCSVSFPGRPKTNESKPDDIYV